MPGLSGVILHVRRKTPATSGQTTMPAGRVVVRLQAGKWNAEKLLPAGGYVVQAELVRSGELGNKLGKEEKIGITVQTLVLHRDAVKKAPLPHLTNTPK